MCLSSICLKLSGIRLRYALFFLFFFWGVNKTFCSWHRCIFKFTSPSTIIKTQNPSSPSKYNSPLLQLMLWNFKRISRYQWCMPLGISVSYIGRGSPSIPIVLFFTILKVLVYALQNEFFLRFDYSFFSFAYAFLHFCE